MLGFGAILSHGVCMGVADSSLTCNIFLWIAIFQCFCPEKQNKNIFRQKHKIRRGRFLDFASQQIYVYLFLGVLGRKCGTARCPHRQPGRHCWGRSRGSVCVPFPGGWTWGGRRGGRWPPYGEWAPPWLNEPRDRRPISSKNPSFLFKVDMDGPLTTPQHGYDRQHRSEFFSFWAFFVSFFKQPI